MSKSLGNVIDPMEIDRLHGADALRFALARQATGGQQDIPLVDGLDRGGRRFANKIWNAARLVLQEFPGGEPQLPPRRAADGAGALAAGAASALPRGGERGARRVRVRAGGAGHLPLLLVRVLRLGPGDGEGPAPSEDEPECGRRGARSWPGCWSGRCGCCTRSCRSSPRRSGSGSAIGETIMVPRGRSDGSPATSRRRRGRGPCGVRRGAGDRRAAVPERAPDPVEVAGRAPASWSGDGGPTPVRRVRAARSSASRVPSGISLARRGRAPGSATPHGPGRDGPAARGVLDPEVERARLGKRLAGARTSATRREAKLANPGFRDQGPGGRRVAEKRKVEASRRRRPRSWSSSRSSADEVRRRPSRDLDRRQPEHMPEPSLDRIRAGRAARPPGADVSDHPRHRHERQDHDRAAPRRHRLRPRPDHRDVHLAPPQSVTERLSVCGGTISEEEFAEECAHLAPYLEVVDARGTARHVLRDAHRAGVPVVRRQAGRPGRVRGRAWAGRGTRRTWSPATWP